MINIINSKEITTDNTTIDMCMEAILNAYDDWYNVEMGDDDTIDKLWITPNMYLHINTSGTVKVICIEHINGESCQLPSVSNTYNQYTIVQTDNAMLFYTSNSCILAIAKTINIDGKESIGVVVCSSTSWYTITDNMTNKKVIPVTSMITDSKVLTQLIPICNPTGNEYFKDVFYTFIRKSSDQAKVVLNNEHYYIYQNIAFKYTDS